MGPALRKNRGGGVTLPHYYVYEPILEHHGVKGMKWGVTRSRPSGGANRLSRRERKAAEKKREEKFYETKALHVMEFAEKHGEKAAIISRLGGDRHHTLMSGKEFVSRLSSGEAFDIKATEIAGGFGVELDVPKGYVAGAYQRKKRSR